MNDGLIAEREKDGKNKKTFTQSRSLEIICMFVRFSKNWCTSHKMFILNVKCLNPARQQGFPLWSFVRNLLIHFTAWRFVNELQRYGVSVGGVITLAGKVPGLTLIWVWKWISFCKRVCRNSPSAEGFLFCFSPILEFPFPLMPSTVSSIVYDDEEEGRRGRPTTDQMW